MPGDKPVSVSKGVYDGLMAEIEAAKTQVIARPKGGVTPTGCTLVVVVEPGGGGSSGCGGSCGIWDRFLGRNCQMVGSTTPDGLETYCICTGGWFNSILRR
jgi:hypothetical protein